MGDPTRGAAARLGAAATAQCLPALSTAIAALAGIYEHICIYVYIYIYIYIYIKID
jgi:hypothetical protein